MIALRRLFQISRSNIGLMKARFCVFLSLSVRQPCQGIVWQVGTIHHPINISFIAGDPGWQTEQRRAVGSWQINHRFPSCSFIPSLNSRAADTMHSGAMEEVDQFWITGTYCLPYCIHSISVGGSSDLTLSTSRKYFECRA